MNIRRSVLSLAIVIGSLSVANATNIGFGQLGGNNTTVPASLGSFATANGNGYVVSNGTTPNIGLTWDPQWDIHTSNFFAPLENLFVGGGAWDNEGNIPRIGQLDFGFHTINFAVDAGFALVLNSFDFGLTGETANTTTTWNITLTAVSSSQVVWNQTVVLTVLGNTSDVRVISPNFTGALGEDYILTFNRTAESFNSNGRHGLDNLSFNQTTVVPEPTTYAVAMVAMLGLLIVARRRKAASRA